MKIGISALLALAIGLPALGQTPPSPTPSSPAPKAQVLKWAHAYETSEPFHAQALLAASEIARKTGERVRIEVVPASQLGNEPEYAGKLSAGTIDIAFVGLGHLSKVYPPLGLSHFPFVFTDLQHVRRFMTSSLADELRAGYEGAVHNHMFALVYYGARHVTANRPVRQPSDMAGMSFRVPDAPPMKLFAQGMKAQVSTQPFSQVYAALKAGELEGQENPLPTILAKKFYEAQKYVSMTAHIYDLTSIVMAGSTWRSLSPQDQGIVTEAITKAALWTSIQVISSELTAEDALRAKGMAIVRVDRAPFRDAINKFSTPMQLGIKEKDYERLLALSPPSQRPLTR